MLQPSSVCIIACDQEMLGKALNEVAISHMPVICIYTDNLSKASAIASKHNLDERIVKIKHINDLYEDINKLTTYTTLMLDHDFVAANHDIDGLLLRYFGLEEVGRTGRCVFLRGNPEQYIDTLSVLPRKTRFEKFKIVSEGRYKAIVCWRRYHEQVRPRRIKLQDIQLLSRFVSSEVVAEYAVSAVIGREPFSVIRLGDGEAGLIRSLYRPTKLWYMEDAEWRKRYGVDGLTPEQIGQSLLNAADKATYVGVNLLGLHFAEWNAWEYLGRSVKFCDQYINKHLIASGSLARICNAGRVGIIHRYADKNKSIWERKLHIHVSAAIPCDSWKDHSSVLSAAEASKCNVFLASVGPSGKELCADIATKCNACVIDCGEALSGLVT